MRNLEICERCVEFQDERDQYEVLPGLDYWCALDDLQFEGHSFIDRGIPKNCAMKLEYLVLNQDEKS